MIFFMINKVCQVARRNSVAFIFFTLVTLNLYSISDLFALIPVYYVIFMILNLTEISFPSNLFSKFVIFASNSFNYLIYLFKL